MQTDVIPDILPINMRKLKAAYRHPFEYINPRLYQKRDLKSNEPADDTAQARFFVDNEEEFQALTLKNNDNSDSNKDILNVNQSE